MRLGRNRPKEIGTRFETAVVRYLREALGDERPERRALSGSHDMGDIAHVFAHGSEGIIECKSVKSWGKKLLAEWQAQTEDECENAGADFALLVVKQPNRPVGEALCFARLSDLCAICNAIRPVGALPQLYDEWVCVPLADACRMMRGA